MAGQKRKLDEGVVVGVDGVIYIDCDEEVPWPSSLRSPPPSTPGYRDTLSAMSSQSPNKRRKVSGIETLADSVDWFDRPLYHATKAKNDARINAWMDKNEKTVEDEDAINFGVYVQGHHRRQIESVDDTPNIHRNKKPAAHRNESPAARLPPVVHVTFDRIMEIGRNAAAPLPPPRYQAPAPENIIENHARPAGQVAPAKWSEIEDMVQYIVEAEVKNGKKTYDACYDARQQLYNICEGLHRRADGSF